MNILIFSWRGPGHPNAGGAEISTHEHAKGWVRAGHMVTLFTSSYLGAKKKETIDDVNIIRSGSQILEVHLNAFKWYIWGKHPKFDLVIDQFHGIPFFTPLYVRFKKLAFIHEVTKEVWSLNPWPWPFNLIPALIGTLMEPLVFKLFYKKIPFMTVSESTKKDLVDWGISGSQVTVIHNGINRHLFKSIPNKEEQKTLIYLGALAKDKGIEDALLIFSQIKIFKNWQFWVVGRTNQMYLNLLKSQSRKLGLEGKIKFWGFVNESKKFELLAKAHIVVNPSVREGWGLVVIEAAAVGTPTAAFNVPGLRESIVKGKTGILADENIVEDLVAKIIKLLADKKEYNRICRNAMIWSKKFSWDKTVRMSLKLIERITG